jgi:hypothetical protein
MTSRPISIPQGGLHRTRTALANTFKERRPGQLADGLGELVDALEKG